MASARMGRFTIVGFSVVGSALGGDPECWADGLSPELCCDLRKGSSGDIRCWDSEYTFERCCNPVVSGERSSVTEPGRPSYDTSRLRVPPLSVTGLPLLGGGSMPMSGLGMCCRPAATGDAARQAVLDYLLMGGRLVDDATHYRNHAKVGEGIRQAVAAGVPRHEIFLTTKISPPYFGFEEATDWVARSLRELGVDYVDLVLLHWAEVPEDGRPCQDARQCRQETWLALQRAKARGQIRHLGVSNFGERQISELLALGGSPVEVNQIEYHPWVPQLHLDTARWCHERGIVVTAYGSLGTSANAQQLLTEDALAGIGRAYQKTVGQVLLRWAIQHNVTVIPGTSNPEHMYDNLNIFDFSLSEKDMAMFDNIPNDQRMLHYNHWPDKAI